MVVVPILERAVLLVTGFEEVASLKSTRSGFNPSYSRSAVSKWRFGLPVILSRDTAAGDLSLVLVSLSCYGEGESSSSLF